MERNIVCVQSDWYKPLLTKAENFLFCETKIPVECPGYTFLQYAIVLRKIYGKMDPDLYAFMLPLFGKLVVPHRDERNNGKADIVEWMIDALIAGNEMEEDDSDQVHFLMSFLKEAADKI